MTAANGLDLAGGEDGHARLCKRFGAAAVTQRSQSTKADALAYLVLGLLVLTSGSSRAQGPVWTDDPLVPGVTPIKVTHFTELRTRINELLTGCGGTAFAFTDATLKAGETPVRAMHVIELRAALGRAYDACGGSRPAWSDPSPARGSVIRARHLTELRDATGVLAARSPSLPSLESYYALIPPTTVDPTYSPEAFFTGSADLDDDGNEDLVIFGSDYWWTGTAPQPTPQPGRVYLGDGDGGFVRAPSDLFPIDALQTVHTAQVAFGELNGDGRPDMFAAHSGWDREPFPGEQNLLLLSRPEGGWQDATDTLPQLDDYSHSAAIGAVRRGHAPDIVVGNGYPGQNGILPYALLNDGTGSFSATQVVRLGDPVRAGTILPIRPGETMGPGTVFPGTVLTDLDGDGLDELIVTADTASTHGNRHTTVFWNDDGAFTERRKTSLPTPAPFTHAHIDLHAASIDADADGRRDLIVVGTQGEPFYQGWFLQLLMNRGDGTFADETRDRVRRNDWFRGTVRAETTAPWAQRIVVLDFNGDEAADFTIRFSGGPFQWPGSQPLVWLNDGAGRFTALRVDDFLEPGMDEWIFASTLRRRDMMYTTTRLIKTRHGYSFIAPQAYAPDGGFVITGLLAIRPYP